MKKPFHESIIENLNNAQTKMADDINNLPNSDALKETMCLLNLIQKTVVPDKEVDSFVKKLTEIEEKFKNSFKKIKEDEERLKTSWELSSKFTDIKISLHVK